jgi:hypothetical protein
LELPQKIATYRLHLKYAENPLHEYDLLKACFEHPAIKPFSLKDIRIHIASLTDLHHSMRKPITWNVEMLSSDAPIILCRMRLAVVKVFVTRKSSPFSSTYPSSSQDAEGINVAAEEEKKPTKIQVTSKDVRRWIEATIETACSEYENMTGMNDTDDVAGADSLRANYKKNGLVKDMCGASVCKSEEDGELYQFWWHVDRDVQGIVMGDRVRTQLLHGGYLAGSD